MTEKKFLPTVMLVGVSLLVGAAFYFLCNAKWEKEQLEAGTRTGSSVAKRPEQSPEGDWSNPEEVISFLESKDPPPPLLIKAKEAKFENLMLAPGQKLMTKGYQIPGTGRFVFSELEAVPTDGGADFVITFRSMDLAGNHKIVHKGPYQIQTGTAHILCLAIEHPEGPMTLNLHLEVDGQMGDFTSVRMREYPKKPKKGKLAE